MHIVKIPGLNNTQRINGCRNAGNAIIKELKNISSNENGVKIDANPLDLEEIHVENSNLKRSNELIYENSMEIFETKPKTIFLGGDHSITYSIFNAFREYCNKKGKKPCLIVFDAHADLSEPSKEPNNREWLRALVEEGFPAQNILLVGARNVSEKESEFVKSSGIKIIKMNQLLENLEETCDIIMEFSSGKELYVSIDINAIDSAFVPSAMNPEPGGLTSREFIYLIQRINKIKNLKAVDLVEINSEEDKEKGNLTVKLAAKIVAEMI